MDENKSNKTELYEIRKGVRIAMIEWIASIAVFITCFTYLANKIDRQSERTDKLYEMFIDLLKDKKT